jgi:hypothetical protein
MSAEQAETLIPPGGLRPAQLGIVFVGRVVLGHLSATIADLAHRGVLTVAEAPGDDWLLTDLRGRSPADPALLPFEKTLLSGLFARQPEVTLSSPGPDLIDALDWTRRSLRRDAVRRGWLRRLRHGQRTPHGEQLLTQIREFRRELRALAASGGLELQPGLVPYAMIFGRGAGEAFGFAADEAEPDPRRDAEVPSSGRFGQCWMTVCTGLLAAAADHQGQPADLAHQWGVPPGHDHGNTGHAPGHSGHGGFGDHGGYGGHHGGGFDGGAGHAGHF